MKRGPKPKSTHLKIAAGMRADRINFAAPQPPPGVPDRPEHIEAEARAEWDRIVPELEKMGVLALIDRAALALYCSMYGRWVQAEKMIAEQGMVIDTARGGLQCNPYVKIARDCAAEAKRLVLEFGGTPSSRSRITSRNEPPKDDLGSFLSNKKG